MHFLPAVVGPDMRRIVLMTHMATMLPSPDAMKWPWLGSKCFWMKSDC